MYPFNPLEDGPAPFPTIAIVFGARKGKTPLVFFSNTVEAAPIVLIRLYKPVHLTVRDEIF